MDIFFLHSLSLSLLFLVVGLKFFFYSLLRNLFTFCPAQKRQCALIQMDCSAKKSRLCWKLGKTEWLKRLKYLFNYFTLFCCYVHRTCESQLDCFIIIFTNEQTKPDLTSFRFLFFFSTDEKNWIILWHEKISCNSFRCALDRITFIRKWNYFLHFSSFFFFDSKAGTFPIKINVHTHTAVAEAVDKSKAQKSFKKLFK